MREFPMLKYYGGLALARTPDFWQRYRFLIYGIIGWALLIANYPFGWQLPKYAEF